VNTNEIRHFLTVLDRGSIAIAADELYISSQGLSQSLKRFEQKLGVRLFVRTPQGMLPTDRALELEPMFRAIATAEDGIFEQISALKNSNRTRYILGRDSMIGDVIRGGVENYTAAHPDTPVELVLMRESEDHLAKIFLEGGYDYRFLSSETNPLGELPQEPLCELPFVPLVGRNTLRVRGTIDFSTLGQMTVLTEYNHFTWVGILEQMCRNAGIELKTREADKDYIVRLLLDRTDTLTFVRRIDLNTTLWSTDNFAVLDDMGLTTQIVIQTVHNHVDTELVEAIRAQIAQSVYTNTL
jgi:DNA-binding transcriptional LysR family regulator